MIESLCGFWGYAIGIIGAIVVMLVDYLILHQWEKNINIIMEGAE